MSADPKPLLEPDPLEVAADQVIAACDGDVRAAVRALIVARGLLEAELNEVGAVAKLVEIGSGVVSGVFNPNDSA